MKTQQHSFKMILFAVFTTALSLGTALAAPPLDPIYMSRVSQGFGVYNVFFKGNHTGVDIPTSGKNPDVYAVADGTVVFNSTNSTKYTDPYSKYLNAFVIIKHADHHGYYGHLTSSISVGKSVKSGEKIGIIRDSFASSGLLNTSNNHLHYSASIGSDWVRSGWGYQSATGMRQFVDPTKFFTAVKLPEIQLTGLGGLEIRSGDTTPSGVDGTDFGRNRLNLPKFTVFSVKNTGAGDLRISSVSLSGSSAFRVSNGFRVNSTYLQPVIIRPGQSLPFTVQFTPTSIFSAVADFEIRSNDSDEARYFFKVKGSGI